MQTSDFYANIADPKAAVPVYLTTSLTPFGIKPPMGTQNQTWSNFKAGTPDAKKFAILGVDTCKRSANCGQQSMQAHRLALRQMHTAAKHMEE